MNEEVYSEVNTILKIGKKRALVDAALSAGRLSEIFTQDLEDLPPGAVSDDAPAPSRPAPAAPEGSEECPICGKKKRANFKMCFICNRDGKTLPVENPEPPFDPTLDYEQVEEPTEAVAGTDGTLDVEGRVLPSEDEGIEVHGQEWVDFNHEVTQAGLTLQDVLPPNSKGVADFIRIGGTIAIARSRFETAKKGPRR